MRLHHYYSRGQNDVLLSDTIIHGQISAANISSVCMYVSAATQSMLDRILSSNHAHTSIVSGRYRGFRGSYIYLLTKFKKQQRTTNIPLSPQLRLIKYQQPFCAWRDTKEQTTNEHSAFTPTTTAEMPGAAPSRGST